MFVPAPESAGPLGVHLAALREGRLIIPRCEACARVHWPPQSRCPHCRAAATGWVAASGRATLESFSRVHQTAEPGLRDRVPFTLAFARLAEGPRLMGWLTEAPAGGWTIGQALSVVLPEGDAPDRGHGMPVFDAARDAGVACPDGDPAGIQARPDGRRDPAEPGTISPGERAHVPPPFRPRDPLRCAAAIRGVGDSAVGRLPDRDALSLCVEAAWAALDDAALDAGEIDALFTAYCTTSPSFVFYGALAEALGIRPAIGLTGNAGGGTAGTLLARAVAAVCCGQARHVLVVAGENRLTGMGTGGATRALSAFAHPWLEAPYGPTVPALYALVAQRYLHDHGLRREHLAPVAVQTRANAARHGGAHRTDPLTIEAVLASRPIAEPLHLLDCCLVSDAAGALVISAAGEAGARPAWIAGLGEQFTHEHLVAAPGALTSSGAAASARQALSMAGLAPADIGVAQLYDCFTVTPVLLAEAIGFADPGRGWTLWQDGGGAVGSALPINTHGGMLSHAHAGAAGGLLAINECVRQVRGGLGPRQAARHGFGLAHVEGGILSNHTTVILGRERT